MKKLVGAPAFFFPFCGAFFSTWMMPRGKTGSNDEQQRKCDLVTSLTCSFCSVWVRESGVEVWGFRRRCRCCRRDSLFHQIHSPPPQFFKLHFHTTVMCLCANTLVVLSIHIYSRRPQQSKPFLVLSPDRKFVFSKFLLFCVR